MQFLIFIFDTEAWKCDERGNFNILLDFLPEREDINLSFCNLKQLCIKTYKTGNDVLILSTIAM